VLELARVVADTATITSVRAAGQSWRAIAVELGIGEGTVRRAFSGIRSPLSRVTFVTAGHTRSQTRPKVTATIVNACFHLCYTALLGPNERRIYLSI
jgi:hypothetical protein